jgi:hypothetical protein
MPFYTLPSLHDFLLVLFPFPLPPAPCSPAAFIIISQLDPPNVNGSAILDDGKTAAEATAAAFDGLWNDVLNGGLYKAIVSIAVFFALVALCAWLITWYKALIEGDEPRAFGELIWVIIVIFLLSGEGAPLRNVTLGMRQVVNKTNNTLLDNASQNIKLQEAFQQVVTRGAAMDNAQAIISQCASISDPTSKDACMTDAITKAKQMGSSSGNDQSWFDNFFQKFSIDSLVQNTIMLAIRGWLMAIGAGFQWCIEISLLLTSLLGPIAVGLTLLPVGQKAIFAWAIGFYTVAFTKLSYNIICGLVATIVLNSGSDDSLLFAFITGILAPILSMAIAAGGGMAIFNSLTSLAAMAARGAAAAASGGISVIVEKAIKD